MEPSVKILASTAAEPNTLFVAAMGVTTVFLGLVCIILLCMLMSIVCKHFRKETAVPAAVHAPAVSQEEIPNRTELIAAITAVIAEEMGADVSAIRVHSLKKIDP